MNKIAMIGLSLIVSTSTVFGLTLEQSVEEVLKNNPKVQERFHSFEVAKEEHKIAYGEYYPKLNLQVSATSNQAGNIKNDVNNINYTEYNTALVLTQNIFNGFKTTNQINYQNSRVLTAGYSYIQTANDTTLEMIERYLNLFTTKETEKALAKSVVEKKKILAKVEGLFDAGIKVKSDVNKINSTYALSRSDLTIRQQNLLKAKIKFQRTYGKEIDISKLKPISIRLDMPKDFEEALDYAYRHNPSLLISKYDIEGAKSLHQESKSEYYPTVDLEVSQSYNDQNKNNNGFSSPDDRFKVMLRLNYNLYNGGNSENQITRNSIKIKQEIQKRDNIKRDIEESIKLSWLSYQSIQTQLEYLEIYALDAKKALKLYKDEYELSSRSLLDLLSIQNDVTNASIKLIEAKHNLLMAKYTLLHDMGTIVLKMKLNNGVYNQLIKSSSK